MPKYQYQCNDCGRPLEVQQSFTEDSLTVCPHCGGNLRKVFNAVGVVFKGSGFYRNDSRSSSGGDSDKPSTPAAPAKEGAPAARESAPSKAPAPAKQASDGSAA